MFIKQKYKVSTKAIYCLRKAILMNSIWLFYWITKNNENFPYIAKPQV
jgi:hypothetical protein